MRKLFWAALAVKMVVAALLPLTNDEAYYWVWSRHMQWSYYDHPSMVAVLFWLGDWVRWLPGSVRWPGVLMAHGTLALWLALLRPYFNDKQILYWLGLALLSPLLGGSSIVVTPDLPYMFFFALSLWLFLRWVKTPHWPLSLALGVAMGLGFSSKYMMVLFGLSLLPVLFVSSEVRQAFGKGWLSIGVGLIAGSFPVWIWNLLNDFASLRFQARHGLGAPVWKPFWTYEYVLAQVGLIFPPVLYWAVRTSFSTTWRNQTQSVFLFLAWTPLVFFFCTTFRGFVEVNWPIGAYPALFALAVMAWPQASRGLKITFGVWGTALALLLFVLCFRPPLPGLSKLREFYQFDAIVARVKDYTPLYARSYQMAAKLHYELQRPVYKLKGFNRLDFYDFLEGSEPREKTYYFLAEHGDRLPNAYLERGHRQVEVIPIGERFELWRVETP